MPSSSSTGPLPAFSEAQFTALRHDSADAVESYLLDSDGLDAVFFLYAIVVYVAARLALNLVAPGLHKSAATASARRYSRQQYLMVFFQKGFVMPVCGLGFLWRAAERANLPVDGSLCPLRLNRECKACARRILGRQHGSPRSSCFHRRLLCGWRAP